MAGDKYTLKGGTVYKKQGRKGYCAQAVYFVPTGKYDENGLALMTRKETSKLFKTRTKTEAKELAKEWVAELNKQEERRKRGVTESTTVAEFMNSYFDSLEAAGEHETSTLAHYRVRAKYITDGLGEVPVLELDAPLVKAWRNRLKKRLAPQTINDAFVLLRSALKDGIENGRLKKDDALDRVLSMDKLKVKKKDPNALDANERARLLADLDTVHPFPENPRAVLAIKIALFTGMRVGEICALRWKNVDFANGLIKVCEALGRVNDSGNELYVKAPKSESGVRVIPMPNYLKPLLEARKKDMRAQCTEAGVKFKSDLYVLGDIDGAPMTPHAVSLSWRKRCIRLNLKGVNGERPKFHDLRHTYATYALNSGADVVSVSKILGHAQVSTTVDIYAADDMDAKRRTMQKAEATLLASAQPSAKIIQLRPTGTEN